MANAKTAGDGEYVAFVRIAWLASCLATAAAWFFLRTGWTPIDHHFVAHQSFAMLGFVALGLSAFFHAIAVALRGGVSKWDVGSFGALSAVIGCYLLLRQFDNGEVILGSTLLFRIALAQKVVLYLAIACLFIQIRSFMSLRQFGFARH